MKGFSKKTICLAIAIVVLIVGTIIAIVIIPNMSSQINEGSMGKSLNNTNDDSNEQSNNAQNSSNEQEKPEEAKPTSRYKKPTEFSYTVDGATVKITSWEFSDLESVHPADSNIEMKMTNVAGKQYIIPFSIEIASGTPKTCVAAIAAKVYYSGMLIQFVERGVVTQSGNTLIRNGYIVATSEDNKYALTIRQESLTDNDIPVPVTIVVAAGPASATGSQAPYRVFALTINGLVDITDVPGRTIGVMSNEKTLGEEVESSPYNTSLIWY